MAHKTFFANPNDATLQFFVSDACISVARGLLYIDTSQPDILSTYDNLVAEAGKNNAHPFSYALEKELQLTTPVATIFLQGFLYNWHKIAPTMLELMAALDVLREEDKTPQGRLLKLAMEAVSSLAILQNTKTAAPEQLVDAEQTLRQVALQLEGVGKLEEALACAVSASNFGNLADPTAAEESTNLSLSLARRTENKTAVSSILSQRAHLLAKIAQSNPERRLDAFDAFEAALTYLPSDPADKEAMLNVLEEWTQNEDYLRILRTMVWAASPARVPPNAPLNIEGVKAAVKPIWEGSMEQWFSHFDYVKDLGLETANARWALFPKITQADARSLWSSWSIEHSKLRRAVPHSSSILREDFLDDLLLEISHEVTHVYSMFGFLGVALTAMRWALLEMELDVWGRIFYESGEPQTHPEFRISPAPLDEPDLIALAFAERVAEMERKIQLVENTWAPWFEGLAVFGELAADPQLDKDSQSPVAAVIYNLWDRSLATEAKNEGLELNQIFARDREKADSMVANAIRSRGVYRLRTYLTRNRQKYLAGYLAVRTVVSHWRSRMKTELRGDQAFRILLHMTRYSDFGVLPDPGLPLEDFERAIRERHLKWVESITLATTEDLGRLLQQDMLPSTAATATHWVNGELKEFNKQEDLWQDISRIAEQSLSSLVGDRADASRVQNASERCRLTMKMVADAFAEKPRELRLFTSDRASGLFSRLVLLPLGQALCAFWLIEDQSLLVCLVLTRERDRESGGPSYDLLIRTLEESEFRSLKERVERGGSRRMIVTRVADLVTGAKNRATGANYLVFQYDDWMSIQPGGALFGVAEVDQTLRSAIENRLSPTSLIADQEALTGDKHPAAQRTVSWIESNDWSALRPTSNITVDVTPWADRVRDVSARVLANDNSDVDAVSLKLLNFVFGDAEVAERMQKDSFAALANTEPPILPEFLKTIDATARRPLENTDALQSLNAEVTSTIGCVLQLSQWGWDVVSPKAITKENSNEHDNSSQPG